MKKILKAGLLALVCIAGVASPLRAGAAKDAYDQAISRLKTGFFISLQSASVTANHYKDALGSLLTRFRLMSSTEQQSYGYGLSSNGSLNQVLVTLKQGIMQPIQRAFGVEGEYRNILNGVDDTLKSMARLVQGNASVQN